MTRLAAAAALVACGFLLAACGGGSADRPSAVPTAARTPAPPEQRAEPAAARTITCPGEARGRTGDGWAYRAEVSPAAGLVVRDLRFGPRTIARELSVPYVRSVGPGREYAHLTSSPRPSDDLRSTLLRTGCGAAGHPGVSATYRLVSASRGTSYLVQQSYRFDPFDPETRCEASETAQCVRFWPTVTWGIERGGEDPAGLEIVQRFAFDPDGMATAPDGTGVASADITKDRIRKRRVGTGHLDIGHKAEHGALLREGAITAVTNGHIDEWENWHQTDRDMVGLPGLPHVMHLGGSGYAGCTECVHAHWSWFGRKDRDSNLEALSTAAKQRLACQSQTCWSRGLPQILPTSRQSACAGWVRADADDADRPVEWCERARTGWSGGSLDPPTAPLALYWDAATPADAVPDGGVTIDGTHMAVGDSYWPQLPAGDTPVASEFAGDTGAMFAVPARRLATVSALTGPGQVVIHPGEPVENPTAGRRLPAGWVVPVALSLAPGRDQGPYYLRVHANGLRLLNAAPNYSEPDTGAPWVYVYDDGGVPDANAQSRRVAAHTSTKRTPVAQPGAPSADLAPMHAFVVFDRRPTARDDVSYELDAAPDGVAGYLPSTGEWVDPASVVKEHDPSSVTEFTIRMRLGWQYTLWEQDGITLRSTGGGLASSLGAYPEGLELGPADGYLLRPTETGSREACFGHLANPPDGPTLAWGPRNDSDTLPWGQLTVSRQACVNDGGNEITLMTVLEPWNGSSLLVHARTWECEPPPDKSVC